jgi:hypothetical protein
MSRVLELYLPTSMCMQYVHGVCTKQVEYAALQETLNDTCKSVNSMSLLHPLSQHIWVLKHKMYVKARSQQLLHTL